MVLTQKVVSVHIKTVSVDILPDPSKITSRPHHADDPRQNGRLGGCRVQKYRLSTRL